MWCPGLSVGVIHTAACAVAEGCTRCHIITTILAAVTRVVAHVAAIGPSGISRAAILDGDLLAVAGNDPGQQPVADTRVGQLGVIVLNLLGKGLEVGHLAQSQHFWLALP